MDVQHECGVGNSKHNLKVTRKTAPFLEVVVQASAGRIIWRGCLFRSCLYGPHTVKSARKCSGVGEERKEGCAEPGNSPRGHSCTATHVLQTCRRGRIGSLKVFLNLLRPRICGALSGVRRLRAALCSVLSHQRKLGYYVMWLSIWAFFCFTPGRFPATFPRFSSSSGNKSSVLPVPRVLHASAALENLGAL